LISVVTIATLRSFQRRLLISTIQHSLISGLNGACIVGHEGVLGGESAMRPQSKIVIGFEIADLSDQFLAECCGRFSGKEWLGLIRLMDRAIRWSMAGALIITFVFSGGHGGGFSWHVGGIEVIFTRDSYEGKQCIAPGIG